MGRIVSAIATSHVPFINTSFAEADKTQAENVLNGFKRLADILHRTQPDVIFVVGDDHFRSFFLDNMPAFCVGIGECEAWGDWKLPKYVIPIAKDFAKDFLKAALQSGFDLAYSLDLKLDHGLVLPLHFITPEMNIPIVPIVVNCCVAPLPTPKRCYQLGEFIRTFVKQRPENEQVAVIASGGLSHWVPFPGIDGIETETDRRMMEMMIHGRSSVAADATSRQATVKKVVTESRERINPEFDRYILDLIAKGKGAKLADFTNEEIEVGGFNGGNEILNWIVLLGAVPGGKASFSLYEAIPAWISGVGMVALDTDS